MICNLSSFFSVPYLLTHLLWIFFLFLTIYTSFHIAAIHCDAPHTSSHILRYNLI